MGEATEQALARAFQLIEEDRLSEAETLLEQILKDEPYNADAWWVYAHAVQDPKSARTALQRVHEINPEYPGATELLDSLEQQYPQLQSDTIPTELKRVTPPPTLPDLPEETDDSISFDDEFGPYEEVSEPITADYATTHEEPERRNLLWVLLPILIVVAIIAIVLLLLRPAAEEDATPTTIAVTTPTSSAEQVRLPTSQVATEAVATSEIQTVSGEIEQAIENALADFGLGDDDISKMNTALGNTLLVSICTSTDIQERSESLNRAMFALSEVGSAVEGDVEALGIRLVNCTTDHVFSVVAAPLDQALSFIEGHTDEKAYQAGWQPVL